MLRRSQLPATHQRVRLRAYLRTLRANYNAAYRELSLVFRIRKGCPFEHALRHRRFEDASQLLKLAEQCLAEINHCYALRMAAFRPGDQILVKLAMRGLAPDPRRYLILDVHWWKRDSHSYEAHELTKGGTLHKGRYPGPLFPSSRVSIEKCDDPLPKDTQWTADSARRKAYDFLETVLQKGDLSLFAPPKSSITHPVVAKPYPFWRRA